MLVLQGERAILSALKALKGRRHRVRLVGLAAAHPRGRREE